MTDAPSSDSVGNRSELTAAGRLLDAIKSRDLTLADIAKFARVPVADLEGCRRGAVRLEPQAQMRLAAAVAALVPEQTRKAHMLFAQAQSELRILAGGGVMVRRDSADGRSTKPESAVSHAESKVGDLTERSASARARSAQLVNEAERLQGAARALVAATGALRAPVTEVLLEEIARFTNAARQHGEPPERALALVKSVVEPELSRVPQEHERIMAQVVDWFVKAYYAA